MTKHKNTNLGVIATMQKNRRIWVCYSILTLVGVIFSLLVPYFLAAAVFGALFTGSTFMWMWGQSIVADAKNNVKRIDKYLAEADEIFN